jgi:hypothetical protein
LDVLYFALVLQFCGRMYFVKDEDSMKMHHQNLQQFLEHGTFKEVNVQAKVIGP